MRNSYLVVSIGRDLKYWLLWKRKHRHGHLHLCIFQINWFCVSIDSKKQLFLKNTKGIVFLPMITFFLQNHRFNHASTKSHCSSVKTWVERHWKLSPFFDFPPFIKSSWRRLFTFPSRIFSKVCCSSLIFFSRHSKQIFFTSCSSLQHWGM